MLSVPTLTKLTTVCLLSALYPITSYIPASTLLPKEHLSPGHPDFHMSLGTAHLMKVHFNKQLPFVIYELSR